MKLGLPAFSYVFAVGACISLAFGSAAGCAASHDRALGTSEDPLALEGVATGTCTRPMKPATRVRKVVVSHPYSNGNSNKKTYEVLELHTTGALTKTGVTFEMGPAGYTPIAFTPDGEIGLVAQTDGTIGVFRFDESGTPQVIDGALAPGFSPSSIVMSPNGDKAYGLDPDTASNNGGVYELDIGCDGTVTPEGLVVPGGGANAMAFLPRSRTKAVLAAIKAFNADDANDTFALDMHGPSLTGQGSTFGANPAIASSMAITPDGKYGLVTDDSLKAGDRVGVITLDSMKPRQILATKSPFQIVTSVYGNAALIVNGDSCDELSMVSYDPSNDTTPFKVTGDMPYTLPPPRLPGAAVQITRGSLTGHVLIAELAVVRQVEFTPAGAVADVSEATWDESNDQVIGTLGVQP